MTDKIVDLLVKLGEKNKFLEFLIEVVLMVLFVICVAIATWILLY